MLGYNEKNFQNWIARRHSGWPKAQWIEGLTAHTKLLIYTHAIFYLLVLKHLKTHMISVENLIF